MSKKITDSVSEEEESLLINPNDMQKRRRQVIIDTEPTDEELVKRLERTGNKIYNHGGRVVVEYETMGRFDIDPVLHFRDFTVSDINDITLSRNEDLLKNLVSILNKCKNEDSECDVGDMVLEEFLETLIGVKMEFNSVKHDHPWLCECQQMLEPDAQTINTTSIDLSTLNYRSIEEADAELREFYKPLFDELTDEQFKDFLAIKYKDQSDIDIDSITKEDELKNLKLTEPIGFKDEEGNIYSFRLTRVKDLLDAQKMVQYKYSGKIKAIKNRTAPQNAVMLDFKAKKDDELEEAQYQQAKDLILYAKAFTLMKYNGKDLSKEEAVGTYKKMPRSILYKVTNFFDTSKFGVIDERELACPLCGESSRRLLRQEFNPFEFLPLDLNSTPKTKTVTGLDIFVGI